VWIGTHSTVGYLEAWAPAIAHVARRCPSLELHLIGAAMEVPGVRVVTHPWSAEREVDLVAAGDIGLAPLPDTDWARGKCGSKLLLYMALGLPAVASPVGVHSEIVHDGEDGVLAATPEQVEQALDLLLHDAGRRERLGGCARARVEAAYSIRRVAPRLAALLHRAAGVG
jgi:glycosyltransferase involved in cell wall biosynthesis